MKNILNIMKLDLVAMNAKKFSLGKAFITAFIISAVTGLLIPPLLLPFTLAFGLMAVPSFIDVEDRNEGEMTFSVLPVTRKETVIARYGLVTAALTITGAVTLLILNISKILGFSKIFDSSDEELSNILSLQINDFGLISLLICTFIAISLIFSSIQLNSFFRYGKNRSGKSALRLMLILFIFAWGSGVILLIENSSLDVKILSSAISVISSLFTALSAPYNGALLSIFILMTAY